MVFLHKIGFANALDYDKLNGRVEQLGKKNLLYKIKYSNAPLDD